MAASRSGRRPLRDMSGLTDVTVPASGSFFTYRLVDFFLLRPLRPVASATAPTAPDTALTAFRPTFLAVVPTPDAPRLLNHASLQWKYVPPLRTSIASWVMTWNRQLHRVTSWLFERACSPPPMCTEEILVPSLAATHAWLLDLSSAALVSGLSSLTPAAFLTGGIAAVTAPLRAPAAAAVSTAPAISFTALTTPGEPRLAVLFCRCQGCVEQRKQLICVLDFRGRTFRSGLRPLGFRG